MHKPYLTWTQIRDDIRKNGHWSIAKNKRGDSKYLTNIIYDPYYNLPKVQTTNHIDEIKYWIGINPTYEKNILWWLNDDDLWDEYCKLYSGYPELLKRLARGSRNTILTNDKTCVSMLWFTNTNDVVSLLVFQRSADVSLGLRYDYLQALWLLEYTCKQLGLKQGKLTYWIGNAHIYLNNLNKQDNHKYIKN